MDNAQATVIGFFADVRDARRAVEELRLAGLGSNVRLIENEQPEDFNLEEATHPSPERRGGLLGFFQRLFGFDDEDEERNPGNWKMARDSEAYFTDAFHSKHSVVVVTDLESPRFAHEILERCGASVEERGNALYEREYLRTKTIGDQEEFDVEENAEIFEGDDIRVSNRRRDGYNGVESGI